MRANNLDTTVLHSAVSPQERKMSILHFTSLDNHREGLLDKITKDAVSVYGWLAGPPMSEKDRVNRELEITRPLRDKNLVAML
jgi:hypothetical protein